MLILTYADVCEMLSDTRVSGASISIDGKKMILVAGGGLLNLWDLPAETSSAGIFSTAKT